jgi:hypothetical protein
MRIRSFAGLDSQKASQTTIVSLKSLLNVPVRRYHSSKCAPQGDGPIGSTGSHPYLPLPTRRKRLPPLAVLVPPVR